MNQNKSKSHWLRRVLLGRPEMGTLLPLALLLAVAALELHSRFSTIVASGASSASFASKAVRAVFCMVLVSAVCMVAT